jgi:hypothetical protein
MFRFTVLGLLAYFYGKRILRWAEADVVQWVLIGLVVLCTVGSIVSVVGWIRRSRKATGERNPKQKREPRSASEPEPRDPELPEQPSEERRFEERKLRGANALVPARRHHPGLAASAQAIERQAAPPALPELEGAASIVQRRRRQHLLDDDEVAV